jgi:short-subunit dehydrogenase
VEYFSRTLQYEYRPFNIEVQVLTPSYIATKMTKWSETLQNPSFVFPDPKTFVNSALATVGKSTEKSLLFQKYLLSSTLISIVFGFNNEKGEATTPPDIGRTVYKCSSTIGSFRNGCTL